MIKPSKFAIYADAALALLYAVIAGIYAFTGPWWLVVIWGTGAVGFAVATRFAVLAYRARVEAARILAEFYGERS